MLVVFEGQDGAGKTALLVAVHEELERCGIDSVVVEEFSDSTYGTVLVEAVARDKFLRPTAGEPATHLTRSLEEVIDLYYLDEWVIGPTLARGQVVLKDRHYDTVLYTLVPTLVTSGAVASGDAALSWLRGALAQLKHRADLTVYVDAPLDVRLGRIRARARPLVEARASEVSGADVQIFVQREDVARQLIQEERHHFLILDNGNRPIHESAEEIIAVVKERLTRAVSEGAP